VSLGGVDRQVNETGEVFFVSRETYPHESFNPTNLNNDIALIKLPAQVAFSELLKYSQNLIL